MSHFDFKLAENHTTLKQEILAGITSFLATMYIIVVNPGILANTSLSYSSVLTATVLVSALSSVLMGLYARNPIVLAPGMGINALFTFTIVGVNDSNLPVEKALGAVFWSGICFFLLSIFNIRTLIVKAIPQQLRYGVAGGIGLFISLIGLKNSGFIVGSPVTLVQRGALDLPVLTFLAGFALTMLLVVKRVSGALILGIIATSLFAIPLGRWWGTAPVLEWKGVWSAPDFSAFGMLDIRGSFTLGLFPAIFTLLFTDLFDSLSTFVGVAEAGNLMDKDGEPRNVKQSLIVDSFATLFSGIFGTSSATSYIESATGIREGGRTGLVAIVAGLLFLPFMFLSPLLSMIPQIATAPALILVGLFMIKPLTKINWEQLDDAIPAFLSLLLIPMTFSITQGIIWGFLSWTVIKACFGKWQDLSWMLILIDILAIVALVVGG